MAMASTELFQPLVCVVDFHHARGPEVEQWHGVHSDEDPAVDNDWSLLPFLALPDGSHSSEEELSYFTLRQKARPGRTASSLFGIACIRHIAADSLINKSPDVTRSSVQKAVVAIVDSPYCFPRIREQLSAVTKAWFAQKDFSDTAIIQSFHESVIQTCKIIDDERDQYFGLSLREFIHEWKFQTLVLLKACLLQTKMIFYGSQCEQICMLQFTLISLIPGLLRSLQDCADPSYNTYEETLVPPSSLRTSERSSLLAYMGLPLQLFGRGSLFGPYTPLQQLEVLSDIGTNSYIAGSTNSLLLAQQEKYAEILVNIDSSTLSILSPTLRSALSLSTSDRRWIDFLTQTVNETWDPQYPSRPTTHGYAGSEEFIRLQFEEYILALLSSIKYRTFVNKHGRDPKSLLSEQYGDPASDFGSQFIESWIHSDNYRIFSKNTDESLFDIVEPRHPCAGGLTIEDVQRRVAQQISELHLDERLSSSKEVISKHLATGQKRVSSAFNSLWADIEVMREAQKKRRADAAAAAAAGGTRGSSRGSSPRSSPKLGAITHLSSSRDRNSSSNSNSNENAADDGINSNSGVHQHLSSAQLKVQAGAAKAGAYLSSWGSWAAEKRKTAAWPSSVTAMAKRTTGHRSSSSPSRSPSSSSRRAAAKAAATPPGARSAAEVGEEEESPEWIEIMHDDDGNNDDDDDDDDNHEYDDDDKRQGRGHGGAEEQRQGQKQQHERIDGVHRNATDETHQSTHHSSSFSSSPAATTDAAAPAGPVKHEQQEQQQNSLANTSIPPSQQPSSASAPASQPQTSSLLSSSSPRAQSQPVSSSSFPSNPPPSSSA